MDNSDNFSPQQRLRLIQPMIEKAKQDVVQNSYYFLLWGWLVFAVLISCTIPGHILSVKEKYLKN